MSDENTLTLTPRSHEKMGILHCGVTREGFIAVAGDVRNIEDGEEITFDKTNVTVTRKGSDYTFKKSA